jgi:hypothetical protein
MASGNQTCNPICADLPKAPQKSKKDIIVILSTSKDKKLKVEFFTQGINVKTIL